MHPALATPAIPDCPRCGETRNVDVVLTGTQQSFYCTVCSHAWVPAPPVDPRQGR